MTDDTGYRYAHFDRSMLRRELTFGKSPRPGAPFPDFDLPTVAGTRVRRRDYLDRKPLLVTFASITCPMTASASPVLKELFETYGDRVDFLTVYVREAHPGGGLPQPRLFRQKVAHARAYAERDQIPWPVAIDQVDGDFHQRMGGRANPTFIMSPDGRIAYRVLWSNDANGLEDGLETVLSGGVGEHVSNVVPLISSLGTMRQTLHAAGREAEQEMLHASPGLYLLSQIAGRISGVPLKSRGFITLSAVTAVAVGFIWTALAARRQLVTTKP